MSDIIERLHGPDGMEAGQEILRLREENARLREAGLELVRQTIAEQQSEIEKLRAALKPFAGILKGNYSHQSDDMRIKAGANQYDLVFDFTLGDLRAARDALKEPGDEKTGV